MKKFIVMFFLLVFLLKTSFSQSYNGIEIGKSLNETKANLLAKGFIPLKESTNISVSYYKYINGKKNKVHVVYTPITKVVWKLMVSVDEATSWMDTKNKYIKYEDILSKKYGEAYKSEINFELPYYDGDGYEIQAIHLDKAEIYTLFSCDKGLVMLEIESFERGKSEILIHYINQSASELYESELQKINSNIY